jgi:4-amino-4-deoxy-L-arabinose transferase-like glycosyltransferase
MKNIELLRNKWVVLLAIFSVALVLRFVFILQWHHTPYGSTPLLDAQSYDEWAQAISHGQLLRDRAFYASPLYPYILGGLYAIFGHSFWAASLLNAILGASTALIISLIACECFGLEAALVAGLLTAGDRTFIFYTAPVAKETLVLFLTSVFLLFATKSLRTNRSFDVMHSGISLGLCALARGNILLLAPLFLILGILSWRGKFIKNSVLFISFTFLCIAPATIHNYIVSQDFIPLNYDDGFNFYVGNSPTANGTNGYPPEISTEPLQEEYGTIAEARQALGRDVKPSEVSSYWRQKAVNFIIHNPAQDLNLLKNKLLAFWNDKAVFDNYDINSFSAHFTSLMSWPLIPFWLITCLAAFGSIAAIPKSRNDTKNLVIFSLIYMISVVLFYVTDRYRLPVLIFLLPLSGAALPALFELVKARKWLRICAAMSLAICFLFLGLKITPAQTPTEKLSVQALIRSALTEQSHGHEGEAERLLNAALQVYPNSGLLEYHYGRLKSMRDELPDALTAFDKAIALSPDYVLSYYEEAEIYIKLGQKEKANQILERGLKANPSDPLLQQELTRISS